MMTLGEYFIHLSKELDQAIKQSQAQREAVFKPRKVKTKVTPKMWLIIASIVLGVIAFNHFTPRPRCSDFRTDVRWDQADQELYQSCIK
jgi:uncharacterized membrane protein